MMGMHRLDAVPPLCFDGSEEELAIAIVDAHDDIVLERGFKPDITERQHDELVGRVVSVISTVFCTVFGSTPEERYVDVFEQAAVFATHLSKDHVFPDGNKRTTVVITIAILARAGFTLDVEDSNNPNENLLYKWIQNVVTGGKCMDELAAFLRDHGKRIDNNLA